MLAGAGGTLGSLPVSPSRSIRLSDPSPPMGDALADPAAVECPRSESPSPTEEERDLSTLAAAPQSPRASPLSPEGASGTLLDTESEEAPLDHLDGKRPPSWEEKQLSLGAPQREGPVDHAGQEFSFLEVSGEGALGMPSHHRGASLGSLFLSHSEDGGFALWPQPPPRDRLWIQGPPVLLWGSVGMLAGVGVLGLPDAGH